MGNLLQSLWNHGKKQDEPQVNNEANSGMLLEQYASQVLDFSTQYGSDRSFSYTAANCLGVPSKFPSYGDFPQTFVMRSFGPWLEKSPGGHFKLQIRNSEPGRCGSVEFIDLLFEYSVFVHAIYVYETLNPGSIIAIWGGDCKGQWKCLWRGDFARIGHQPRQFGPPIQPTTFPVNQIKIVFDGYELPNHAAIDAICLLGTINYPKSDSSPHPVIGPLLKTVLEKKLHLNVVTVSSRGQVLSSSSSTFGSDNGCFDMVPREAMVHIFRHLDFHSLVRCSQVSRLFRQVASDPLLYTRVDLRPLFHIACNGTLKFLSSKSLYIRYLDLSWCGNYGKISPANLRTFVFARGSKLHHLLLTNCHVATSDILNAISRTCCRLVDLELSNCHILDAGSFGTLSLLNNLQNLNVYRTQIGNSELKGIIAANKLLKCLNVAACPNINGDDTCQTLAFHCNQLLAVDFWRCPTLTARGVVALSRIPTLQDLDLGWCVHVNASVDQCIRKLVEGCPKLRRLFLTAHRQTSDSDIEAVSQLGCELLQFNCMGSRSVGREAMLGLARSCPDLMMLDIGYCEQLENPEFQRDLHILLPNCHIVTSLNGS